MTTLRTQLATTILPAFAKLCPNRELSGRCPTCATQADLAAAAVEGLVEGLVAAARVEARREALGEAQATIEALTPVRRDGFGDAWYVVDAREALAGLVARGEAPTEDARVEDDAP